MNPRDVKILQDMLYRDAVEYEEIDIKSSCKAGLRWIHSEKIALTNLKEIERNPDYWL